MCDDCPSSLSPLRHMAACPDSSHVSCITTLTTFAEFKSKFILNNTFTVTNLHEPQTVEVWVGFGGAHYATLKFSLPEKSFSQTRDVTFQSTFFSIFGLIINCYLSSPSLSLISIHHIHWLIHCKVIIYFFIFQNLHFFAAISRGCSKAPALARRGHYNRWKQFK